VFLQDGRHLSAFDSGLWLVPSGVFIVVGAQLGGRLTQRVDTTLVVRMGLVIEAVGLAVMALVISPDLTFWVVFPAFALFGVGLGFASSQLTNVVLSYIPGEQAGTASGANTTVRQIGSALGIATIGSLLSTQTTSSAVSRVQASTLAPALRDAATSGIRAAGVGFRPPPGTSHRDAGVLSRILEQAIAHGARPSLVFATVVVSAGAALSFLIPRLGPTTSPDVSDALETIDPVQRLEVFDAL
jgi:MFS family permease